jgi:hypothetical protein
MCDNALLSGMALGRQPVDSEVVNEVCRDFDLRATAENAPEVAPEVHETRDATLPWTSGPVRAAADRAEESPDEFSRPEATKRVLFGSHKG